MPLWLNGSPQLVNCKYTTVSVIVYTEYKKGAEPFYTKSSQLPVNYTDDLIKRLYQKYPLDEFFFIIGEDNVEELQFWHNYRWLLDNLKFIVLSRNGVMKPNWISLDYVKKMNFLKMKPIDVSSTQIKTKILAGESIKSLVPISVVNEIIKLYS